METTEELQQLEITALKSIYDQDFFEPPPPKVWKVCQYPISFDFLFMAFKAAARLPEFIIKVVHPDPLHAPKVYFHLHIKFPKTYPTLATPIFTIQKPIRGLGHDVEAALSKVIHSEAQKLRGSEMVFQIITTAQEWIAERVQPPSEASGSLATEMTKRATQEERERREREAAEEERQSELAARIAEQLQEQLQADAQKHLIAKEMQYKAARRRAQSDATEIPSVGDTLTESFPIEVEFRGIRFSAVKMFHPRKESLGVTYLADPLCDDVHATLPLEVHTIEFNSQYYVDFQDLASMPLSSPTRTNTPSIPIPGPRTPVGNGNHYATSPEKDYRITFSTKHASRWKEDWEELELLGRGAFGSVVKARNRIDSRTYAVKKIRLRTDQKDTRIFREFERREKSDPFSIDLDDLDDYGGSGSKSSFPSIHFTRSEMKDEKDDDDDDDDDSDDVFEHLFTSEYGEEVDMTPPPVLPRTLYIQMEFVERQTLKERVAEGLSEEEAWRLFNQILEALVHMGSMGILHRDIKLTNIFIDGKGDCKVGDFGLATSSLAAVDPSDLSPQVSQSDSDFTLAAPDSTHYQTLLSVLFKRPASQISQARNLSYDLEAEIPEHANLNPIVEDRLKTIFRLHGAIDMEPPLLVPSTNPEENEPRATFIDKHGDVIFLPNQALIPFARMAARNSVKRIKRFHIVIPIALVKAAVLDIITPDMKNGMTAAGTEIILLLSDCLRSFPTLAQTYEIHISHSRTEFRKTYDQQSWISSISLNRPQSQKRAALLKKGLLRSTADELEVFSEIEEDIDGLLMKLEKISPSLLTVMKPAVDEIKQSIQFATAAGFNGPIYVLAGRYDNLIARYSAGKAKSDPICAFAVQIAFDKIAANLAGFQSTSVKALIKEQRSFGFWSPRRCDVYIMSYQPGYLQDRLEVAALLWQNNISADIMYDATLAEPDNESHLECVHEGILFLLYPRPRTQRREQAAFKVKSVLRVTRQDLVGWLHQQIAEQKRIDSSTSGTAGYPSAIPAAIGGKDTSGGGSEIQLLLPVDTKKQRKQVKQILLDRAYERGTNLKTAITNGVPMLAIDVPGTVFDALVKSATWIHDDETWKPIVAAMPPLQTTYAFQLRDAVAKRKAEGHPFIILYATREERIQILSLSQGLP
ncbi:hypothetical protein JVU11DRAFT_9640, partial [Chiua virens]